MAIYKKVTTKAVPESAELFEKNGKRYARWTGKDGAPHSAPVMGEPGKERVRVESREWYVRIKMADGSRQDINSRCRDKSAAAAWLAARTREQERVKAGVVTTAELDTVTAGRKPLGDSIEAFLKSMRDNGRTEKHVSGVARYIERAAEGLGWKTLTDLDGEALSGWLANEGHGARVCNAFIEAHASLGNWAARTKRLVRNPFEHIERRNQRADRRHIRRALTLEELPRLFDAARLCARPRPTFQRRHGLGWNGLAKHGPWPTG